MSEQRSMGPAGATGTVEKNGAAAPVPAGPRRATPPKSRALQALRKGLLLAAVLVVGIAGYFAWKWFQPAKLPAGFVSSNGRIEATEIDIATKLAERIKDELVDEGDY